MNVVTKGMGTKNKNNNKNNHNNRKHNNNNNNNFLGLKHFPNRSDTGKGLQH